MNQSSFFNYASPGENNKQTIHSKRIKGKQYSQKDHYLIIDSRDRDRSIYPDTNRFVVPFNSNSSFGVQDQFKNIVSIELIDAILPSTAISLEPYVSLTIPELKPSYSGTNDNLSNTFAILIPESSTSPFSRCKFNIPVLNKFKTPIASLYKLTLEFRSGDGTLFSFGADTVSPAPPNKSVQTQLIFKITTMESDFSVLEPLLV
jgi:hypothetical protein